MSRVRLIAGLFLLLLATTWVVLLMLLQHPSRGPASGISHRPAANLDIYLALAPSYAAAAIVTVIMFAGLILSQLRNSKKATALARWAIMFGVVMIAWILIVFAMDDAPSWAASLHPTRFVLVVLSLFPWIALLAVFIFLAKRRVARQWKTSPAVRRQRTMIVDGDGLTTSDELSILHYRWRYFSRAWETPNTLVLVDEIRRGHVLPKRAFSTPADLQTAVSLIATHVPDSKFLTRRQGFDVTARAQQAPLPVLPIESSANETSA
jgi:hypothetical protein